MRKIRKIQAAFLVLMIACLLCACTELESANLQPNTQAEESSSLEKPSIEQSEASTADSESEEPEPEETAFVFSLKDIPEYSDSPYVEVNGNKPCFGSNDKAIISAFEFYSDLDSLGRCGEAYANICKEIMPTEERGSIGSVRPSGWHTVKYNNIIDGNYLYNRCHLIGYQLAGENANEKNLITGTRYMNVMGMLPFEDTVDDYVDSTGNHVLYRVTPIFDGDNLVASGVEMEAWSVEDEGRGLCFHVYCYNVQPGIEINYSNGDSKEVASTADESDEEKSDFIINKNTKKFHRPNCRSVGQMKEKNKQEYTGTYDELVEQGYEPCKNCF